MAWVDSWDHFEMMLKWKFVDVPGLTKIEKGEYALVDAFSKKDIDRNRPIRTAFRPGRTITMSMVFLMNLEARWCPKCDSLVVEREGLENYW